MGDNYSTTTEEESQIAPSGYDGTRVGTNASLQALQGDEQRLVLDTVSQVRKCGLEGILALPQLVVCGDQSAGKSSVLEAITEIPFPRKDELCTRFATEITMRHSAMDSLTIKIIPDEGRPSAEQESLKAFRETIGDFEDLPIIMDKAMKMMGIGDPSTQSKAFARDVLSVDIEGQDKPQLTLVDLPGIIQNETKGVTQTDVKLVSEITDHYISQSRTICLAVVSATSDYANQSILTKVRKFDPEGDRTLGIITKPDRLPAGSGAELAYIKLAQNEDVFFKLGWHVVKNRSFEEGDISFSERNISERSYFRTSNFKDLPETSVGVQQLSGRLSSLLFAHIRQELPKLHNDLTRALQEAQSQLSVLGQSRSSSADCRSYLMHLSLEFHKVCIAAVGGHYEGPFFKYNSKEDFNPKAPSALRRLRAMVQKENAIFTSIMRQYGHTYYVEWPEKPPKTEDVPSQGVNPPDSMILAVQKLSQSDAIAWVRNAVLRNRGRELQGNFNPLLISELFWEQSQKWEGIASGHVETIASFCYQFLRKLLQEMCPQDVFSRLWSSHFEESLRKRRDAAARELELILEDVSGYPINYNHYYTDILQKCRRERDQKSLSKSLDGATIHDDHDDDKEKKSVQVVVGHLLSNFLPIQQDMEFHSCEEALDGVLAIYKVTQKTFIANVTTQVIERHIVRGLEDIFSPIFVSKLETTGVEGFVSEPAATKRQRAFLEDRIARLKEGHTVLRRVMQTAV